MQTVTIPQTIEAVLPTNAAPETQEISVEALRTQLYAEIAEGRSQHRRWLFWKVMRFFVGFTLLFCLHSVYRHNPFMRSLLVQLMFVGLMKGFVDATARSRRETVALIRGLDEPRLIGPLALCLSDKDADVHRMAREGLLKLLPQLRATDRQHINEAEMDALIETLTGEDRQLQRVILQAFEQIGDERALSTVSHLAQGWGPQEIIDAAKECLPYLQQRAEAVRQAQTLLRASGANAVTPPETLLRAVR